MNDPKQILLYLVLSELRSTGIEDPDVQLFLGVLEGNTETVEKALEAGANVTVTDIELVRKYRDRLMIPPATEILTREVINVLLSQRVDVPNLF